ncbi:MAG: hypothetical protein L0229_21980 [Blastocatellia bacterium]|nr:hypothetical protein [Blastocatellia bacterium]
MAGGWIDTTIREGRSQKVSSWHSHAERDIFQRKDNHHLPRHTFSFPEEIRNAVKQYTKSRIERLDPRRYTQEPQYYVALIHDLEGVPYEGAYGFVRFEATAFNDRAPNSSESILGADFAITATISDGNLTVRKAILFQAKRGAIEKMIPSKIEGLKDDIKKMKRWTRSPKVMEILDENGTRQPRIISGNYLIADRKYTSLNLGDYFVRRVLTTFDGDTREFFVDEVQDSSLIKLRIRAGLTR